MMGRDLSRALDPALLASDCGIVCDEWQARALRERHKRSIWLCSRQCGKTTTAAIMALHTVLYEPPALGSNHQQRGARDLYQRRAPCWQGAARVKPRRHAEQW